MIHERQNLIFDGISNEISQSHTLMSIINLMLLLDGSVKASAHRMDNGP